MRKYKLCFLVAVFLIPAYCFAQQPRPTAPQPRPAVTAPAMAATTPAPKPEAPKPKVEEPKKEEPKAEKKEEKKEETKKGEDSWWKVLIGGIIEILLLFLGALGIGLGGLLVKWLTKKLKITELEKAKQYEDLYNAAITLGVNFAKQQAHRLKNSPDAKAKRLEWAVEKATELIKEFNIPEKAAKWIKDRIEAKIGETERD